MTSFSADYVKRILYWYRFGITIRAKYLEYIRLAETELV